MIYTCTNFFVAEANHPVSLSLRFSGALCVFFRLFTCKMASSIYLDDSLFAQTDEIGNISAYRMLPPEVGAQSVVDKPFPYGDFCRRRVIVHPFGSLQGQQAGLPVRSLISTSHGFTVVLPPFGRKRSGEFSLLPLFTILSPDWGGCVLPLFRRLEAGITVRSAPAP